MNRNRPRIVIAGTGSGAGKTTVTIGLMAELQRLGLKVQGFKCGPDYIDPSYHTAVTGRPSRNLDAWMATRDTVKELFRRGSEGADLSVIEGVMGLFDGKDPLSDSGSTAEIAELLDAPVLLVVSVQSMARSAAAVVLGFQKLGPRLRIAGVIVNMCGSEGHYKLVQSAIEQECGIPVLGWLGRDETLHVPERHLGLVPAVERGEWEPFFRQAADAVERGVDLDAVLSLARDVTEPAQPADLLFQERRGADGERPLIAVARDAAFHFYYPENIELLEWLGADICTFSPLAGDFVPEEADGVYIGGGFPEEFAAELAGHRHVMDDLKRRVGAGLPVYAECGGYMYLARSITDRSGVTHEMAGLIPARVKMQSGLAALGYREVKGMRDSMILREGETIRGHEFHYSVLTPEEDDYPYTDYPYAYESKGLRGLLREGFAKGSLTAGYTHVYFPSNPQAAERWIGCCAKYRSGKTGCER